MPLAAAMMKPICGYIIDRTQNATVTLLVLQVTLIVFTGVLFLSPAVKDGTLYSNGILNCSSQSFIFLNSSSELCYPFQEHSNISKVCNLTLEDGDWTQNGDNHSSSAVVKLSNATFACEALEDRRTVPWNESATAMLRCSCSSGQEAHSNLWRYAVSLVISGALAMTIFTVSDSVTCEALGNNAKLFGKQRLWGTIGWGILNPIIGFTIDKTSVLGVSMFTDYAPGFYVFAAFTIVDVILIACIPRLRTADFSVNFFRDLASLLCSVEVVVFTMWTFVTGLFIGAMWTYSTWFLEDMGASKLMIGLANMVMSLAVEVPLFFVSSSTLETLGYFLSYSITFVLIAVKFLAYSFLLNPWYGLLIEIFGGAIFPLAYASMTVFAKVVAKPGTSASMVCVLGATFEGLGE